MALLIGGGKSKLLFQLGQAWRDKPIKQRVEHGVPLVAAKTARSAQDNLTALTERLNRPDMQELTRYLNELDRSYPTLNFPLQNLGGSNVVLSLTPRGVGMHQVWDTAEFDAKVSAVPMKGWLGTAAPVLSEINWPHLEARLSQGYQLMKSAKAGKTALPGEFGQRPLDYVTRSSDAKLDRPRSDLEIGHGGD